MMKSFGVLLFSIRYYSIDCCITYVSADANGIDGSYEITSLGLGACIRLPISKRVYPFLKFGLHSWDINTNSERVSNTTFSTLVGVPIEDRGVNIFYGVGAEIFLFKNTLEKLALRMAIERFQYNETEMDLISAGLLWRFL